MHAMKVIEKSNNVLFTVSDGETEVRAIQMVDRLEDGGNVFATTRIEMDDIVLVCEIEQMLYAPSQSIGTDDSDAISHIIVGLIPPSHVHSLKRGLVRVNLSAD